MPRNIFEWIFLAGLVLIEVVRFPHRMRNKQARRQKSLASTSTTPLQIALDFTVFAATEIIPLVYLFSAWLNFANIPMPTGLSVALGGAGTVLLLAGIALLRRAHADLGRNWSPTLEISQEHQLITQGVYSQIRHPLYAAMWLFTLAQVLMLHNWIAGPVGIITYAVLYLVRVPREEEMMLKQYGKSYREYMKKTGRVLPR